MFTQKVTDNNEFVMDTSWDMLTFFMFVVGVEHILLLLRLGVQQLIDDVPAEIMRDSKDRAEIRKKFMQET